MSNTFQMGHCEDCLNYSFKVKQLIAEVERLTILCDKKYTPPRDYEAAWTMTVAQRCVEIVHNYRYSTPYPQVTDAVEGIMNDICNEFYLGASDEA